MMCQKVQIGKHVVVDMCDVCISWPEPVGGLEVYVLSTLILILHFTDTMR